MTQHINDGGPAFSCSRCGEEATHKQGNQRLCPRHYRFGQMRATAKRRGLVVPSHQHLEKLAARGMCCPDCNAVMNWLGRDGQTHVASLQHYRDGELAIVCRSCNTRHAFAPGDSYRENPADTKHCPSCKTFKPLTDFYKDSRRSGAMQLKSWCKQCSSKSHAEWQRNNRDRYNEKQREWRAVRRADAMLAEREKRSAK